MARFLIPIAGLRVPSAWTIGPVVVRPSDDVRAELDREFGDRPGREPFEELLAEQQAGAIADLDAADHDHAIDVVAKAVDVLRVFQHVQHWTSALTQFGLSGDLSRGVIPYAELGDERRGYGFTTRGEHLGWAFVDDEEWNSASLFHWVASGIDAASPTEAQRRALIGVQLVSQALVEQRAAFKMVGLVTALEAWLLPRHRGSQTYRLARAIAYFGCGRHDNNLCGRDRDTCPYLALDPGMPNEAKELKRLRDRGNTDVRWRCSEWHRVVDWYDLRSDIVHGAGPEIEPRDASNSLFWVVRYLTVAILEWLEAHPHDPIAALDTAVAKLPPMPDWETIIRSTT